MNFYTYILYNSSIDKYYIGSTQNIQNRIIDHNKKNHKSKFTRKQIGTWMLVYKEEFNSKSEAMIRERQIKSWKSKKMIASLIEQSRL